MKAAQISSYGDPSVIEINEVDQPAIKLSQVLVEVHAASLNPFDTTVRKGYMKEFIPLQFPATVGGDFAGIVTNVGEEVTDIKVGDKVYGQANVFAGNSGALAEYVAVSNGSTALFSEKLDFEQAASLPLVGVCALQALYEHIDLQPNQKIFIHGGAGGIGTIAIQLAKHIGAYVATTATGDGIDITRQLGADEVIDYQANDFTELLSNYDAVFDTVGGKDFNRTLGILRKNGVGVTMIADVDEARAAELEVTAIRQSTRVTTAMLDKLSELVTNDVISPQVGQVFPLDQIKEAFEARESGHIHGKVVIKIK